MIKITDAEVVGWEAAIRGMRNPMNSHEKIDSEFYVSCNICNNPHYQCEECPVQYMEERCLIGPNDHDLMMRLRNAGTDHRKFMRMIVVYVDVTAPFYWWKEYDTYKVGTVANSCSTMHKITEKEFTLDDFSHEHLINMFEEPLPYSENELCCFNGIEGLKEIVDLLNCARINYLQTKDKKYWWQIIQLLPSSYNQKRTIMLNYEVLANIYHSRKDHKLDEWHIFCDWIETLPYSELITG